MKKNILFIQGGGGEEDHAGDAKLVESLHKVLGEEYSIHYPLLPNEDSPDFGRSKQIEKEISLIEDDVILVGHSLGASMLLKYLSENKIKKTILGIFLVSTPFWSGDEDWVQGFKLKKNFSAKLPKNIPLFFYHCLDDDEISFDHLSIYKQNLPRAVFREIPSGGHQMNNDLSIVAKDIQSL
jgi:predicted alpha/beta hydrolase family esterase